MELSKTIQCMSSVYMYTTYSEPGRNLLGPVERYKTLHCMSSVDCETRYIVAAICGVASPPGGISDQTGV